jgi:hypothetical protein
MYYPVREGVEGSNIEKKTFWSIGFLTIPIL